MTEFVSFEYSYDNILNDDLVIKKFESWPKFKNLSYLLCKKTSDIDFKMD